MKNFAIAAGLALAAAAASASTITYQTGATFESGLANAAAYRSEVLAAVAGSPVIALASYDSLDLSDLRDFALASTVTFWVSTPGTIEIRAGVDFGGGGALFLDGHALDAKSTDMWWNYSYADDSQYLGNTSPATLSVGAHSVNLYGFEGCCSGNSQLQYSLDGGQTFQSFSSTDTLPPIPEAQGWAMLLAGLGLVATTARRRVRKPA